MAKKKAQEKNYLKLRDPDDNLDFGRLIAEQDDNLAQYYVAPHRYVKRAINPDDPAVFYIGPKGIGKSAILQMVRLEKYMDVNRIINIKPDDLAFSALADAQATSPLLQDAGRNQWLFKALWDYILTLEIFRREFPDANALNGFFASWFQGPFEKEARRLVQLSDGANGATLTSRIVQLIREVELSGGVAGANVAASVKLDSAKTGESFQLLGLVNSVAKRLPDSLDHTYYVLIDDLDLYWNDSPTQNAFIAALFTSLKHLSRPPNVKAVVALRQNIYKALPLVDRDKYHDSVCLVQWDHQSVRSMVEQRVIFKLNIALSEVWSKLFPPGAFDTMWSHSNGRPREAIRLATLAANLAADQGHLQISEDDLHRAVRKFSDERLLEITAEVQYKYPSLEQIIRKMSGWPKEFPFSKIEELLELMCLEIEAEIKGSEKYSWVRGYGDNPIAFVELLIEQNVLWIKLSRTDEARQFDPSNPVEVNRDRWFAVHPMLGPALGLVGA